MIAAEKTKARLRNPTNCIELHVPGHVAKINLEERMKERLKVHTEQLGYAGCKYRIQVTNAASRLDHFNMLAPLLSFFSGENVKPSCDIML